MENSYHESVLLKETVDGLGIKPNGVYVDATLGGGGHSEILLKQLGPEAKLIGIDRDPDAIEAATERLAAFKDQVLLIRAPFWNLEHIIAEQGLTHITGILFDLGISSHQIDDAKRGFSFQQNGPLDMRMGPDAQRVTDLIDASSERDLAKILAVYGEIRGAGRLARAILRARAQGVLETTGQLAELSGPRRGQRVHPATKLFQALRIAANRELESLEAVVDSLPSVLAPGGRAAFISFHSLEDRIVKHGVRRLEHGCTCPRDLPECVCGFVQRVKRYGGLRRPTEKEIARNPRSRSARLRGAVKIQEA